MAVKALVVTLDTNREQTDINTALTAAAIPAANFLGAVTISNQETNQKAKVVIFYDG